jgi:hypothetical protein
MAFQVKTGSEANETDYSAITLRRIVLELLGHYANLGYTKWLPCISFLCYKIRYRFLLVCLRSCAASKLKDSPDNWSDSNALWLVLTELNLCRLSFVYVRMQIVLKWSRETQAEHKRTVL